mmetsp:Transcript_6123/g.10281  ORF Transcript_6123/g.10281 Transcript_6123/m.10281 type:complete len:104 (+) Transcript_6123:619-930(+)
MVPISTDRTRCYCYCVVSVFCLTFTLIPKDQKGQRRSVVLFATVEFVDVTGASRISSMELRFNSISAADSALCSQPGRCQRNLSTVVPEQELLTNLSSESRRI